MAATNFYDAFDEALISQEQLAARIQLAHQHQRLLYDLLLIRRDVAAVIRAKKNTVHLAHGGNENHIDEIDQRVLRGGRFSENELGVPDIPGYLRLIPCFLGRTPLANGFEAVHLAKRIRGMAPVDLEAATNSAKLMALNRAGLETEQVPPLIWTDIEEAIKRNRAVVRRSAGEV